MVGSSPINPAPGFQTASQLLQREQAPGSTSQPSHVPSSQDTRMDIDGSSRPSKRSPTHDNEADLSSTFSELIVTPPPPPASQLPSTRKRTYSSDSRSTSSRSSRYRRSKRQHREPKFYALRIGRVPGVYETWADLEPQIDGFPGPLFKTFPTREAAQRFVGIGLTESPFSQFILGLDQRDAVSLRTSQPSKAIAAAHTAPIEMQSASPEAEPSLTVQQQTILDRIIAGENIFFTGPAGTGKSVLLRAIIKTFRDRQNVQPFPMQLPSRSAEVKSDLAKLLPADDRKPTSAANVWQVGVTASTGLAALNIGGCTLHSWTGIGLGKETKEELLTFIENDQNSSRRWKESRALIIDEISMIDGNLFDKLEWIGRQIRKCHYKPFGGLQIVLSGDFFQLPPVQKKDGPPVRFCFEANCWTDVFTPSSMVSLKQVFRQTDNAFVSLLARMRLGNLRDSDVSLLSQCDRAIKYPDGVEPIALYATNNEVRQINRARLADLSGAPQIYLASDMAGIDARGRQLSQADATKRLNSDTIWPEELQLKIGALVMLVTNMRNGFLVNGSSGKVVEFATIADANVKGYHVPATVHIQDNTSQLWPVIEFVPSRFASVPMPKRFLICRMTVEITNPANKMLASRFQVPLILAWALTVHKAQGQTLERVKVELAKTFAAGQTYVAISRAISLDSLELRNFSKATVKTSSCVVQWAKRLEQEQADEAAFDEIVASFEPTV